MRLNNVFGHRDHTDHHITIISSFDSQCNILLLDDGLTFLKAQIFKIRFLSESNGDGLEAKKCFVPEMDQTMGRKMCKFCLQIMCHWDGFLGFNGARNKIGGGANCQITNMLHCGIKSYILAKIGKF